MAVRRILWESGLEDLGISLAEWNVNAARRSAAPRQDSRRDAARRVELTEVLQIY